MSSWSEYMRQFGGEEYEHEERLRKAYESGPKPCPNCGKSLSFVEWLMERCYTCGWS
jgi:transposase